MFVLIVCICLFLSHFIDKYKMYYLSEAGGAMVFGLIVGAVLTNFSDEETTFMDFDPEIFFYILLPPIIFEAGFSLKRRRFFQNIGTILLFAIPGTIISTLVVGFGLYALMMATDIPLTNFYECLLFGSLISAVDPVGMLAVLGRKKTNAADPLLTSLIFGESVLSDAVAVVLYVTIEDVGDETDAEVLLTFEDQAMTIVGKFCACWIASFLIGCATALICAAILKNINFHEDASLEITIFIVFAYGSYSVAEILGMSGIVSVFFCGIVMGQYAWYNVSQVCQISVFNSITSFRVLSEIFVYSYVGITMGISFDSNSEYFDWSTQLVFFTLVLCLLGRALIIFPFSFLVNCRRVKKITFSMQLLLWFSGLRGAIAFALAINVSNDVTSRGVILTTTTFMVFFTTIFCGGLTDRMLTALDLKVRQRMRVPSHELGEIDDVGPPYVLTVPPPKRLH
jgi:sodium/hydrogen exchanger 8